MDNYLNLRKSLWSDAAKAGAIIGLLVGALEIVKIGFRLPGSSLSWLTTIAELVILAGGIYVFGSRRAARYGPLGFTFGQSMGYILLMMVFAGAIYGFAEYLLQNYIAPDYYEAVYEQALEQVEGMGASFEESMDTLMRVMKNPVIMVLGGIISLVLYGGIIGLFASAFIRRRPDPFTDLPPQEGSGDVL